MDTAHNPDLFMGDLRQILSQGRKRIGFLVGAGAPVSVRVNNTGQLDENGSPLLPTVAQLTEIALGKMVGAQLLAASAITEELGASADIESILSKVRLMERALGTTQVHGLDGVGYKALAEAICKAIGEAVGAELPKGRTPFSELVAWISGAQRNLPVEIFTTNYDLLFEEAFEAARVSYFDGFTGGKRPFFDPVSVASDDLPSRWVRLWKLHGSLGWKIDEGAISRDGSKSASGLIYPDHLKYDLTQKQPYTALFERLRQFLLTPDTLLLVCGFSFRDRHVTAVLDEALSMNRNAAAIAFQYNDLAAEEPVAKLASNRPNLSVYARDGAIVGGVEGKWRPGELPKNWGEIRKTFWAEPKEGLPTRFLLGDFVSLARFCALSQTTAFEEVAPVEALTPLDAGVVSAAAMAPLVVASTPASAQAAPPPAAIADQASLFGATLGPTGEPNE